MNAVDTNTGKSIKDQNTFVRFWKKTWVVTKKVSKVIIGRTIPQKLFRLYFLIIIVGALLLAAPFCLQQINVDGKMVQLNGFTGVADYTFWKALFIACSGFSDTGLTPVPIYTYLNTGGQVVMVILIEIGGIGVVALFYYIWNAFRKKDSKIDVGQLYIMQAERGGSKLSESFKVVKTALLFMLITQVVFMFLYSFCFCFIPAYEQQFLPGLEDHSFSFDSNVLIGNGKLYHNYGNSLWTGLFTTVSALNNAGFDNISANSMAPYRNNWGSILQLLIVIELVIGGLGHFVAFDIIEKIKAKAHHKHYKMTLYSKVAVSVYIIVAVVTIAASFAFEFTDASVYSSSKMLTIVGNSSVNGEFGVIGRDNIMYNKCVTIIFNSFNCRSLGMETIKSDLFVEGTKWTSCIAMFIGASPCSTAGGIRTTTLAIIVVTIWCKLLGRKNVFFFKRRISQETVTDAFMIFFISLVLIILAVIVLYSATPAKNPATGVPFTVSEFLMECCSAFGTVGLSVGITAVTKWWGLLVLIILMFVGQLGIINTLLSWTRVHPHFNDIEYPYEDIKIG